jgi:hypothetical protein
MAVTFPAWKKLLGHCAKLSQNPVEPSGKNLTTVRNLWSLIASMMGDSCRKWVSVKTHGIPIQEILANRPRTLPPGEGTEVNLILGSDPAPDLHLSTEETPLVLPLRPRHHALATI